MSDDYLGLDLRMRYISPGCGLCLGSYTAPEVVDGAVQTPIILISHYHRLFSTETAAKTMQKFSCRGVLVLILLYIFVLISICDSTESSPSRRTKRSNYDAFLLAHTLNPSDPRYSYFEYWTPTDWDYWQKRREPIHDVAEDYKGIPLTRRAVTAVVVASYRDVEDAFTGHLVPYGYDGVYWSNRRFRTYILHRQGSYLSVYDCGKLYFAAKLRRGYPVQFYSLYPNGDYYSRDDHFDFDRHCYRVPNHSSHSYPSYPPYGSTQGTAYDYGSYAPGHRQYYNVYTYG